MKRKADANVFRRKIAGWGGLSVPKDLTDEQKARMKPKIVVPEGLPPGLIKFTVFYETTYADVLNQVGYDPTKHFSLSPLFSILFQHPESHEADYLQCVRIRWCARNFNVAPLDGR